MTSIIATPPKSIFFTGGTGYIGGSVLEKLSHILVESTSVQVLVRSKEKADILEKLSIKGIKPVVGSLEDLEAIEEYARKSDIVISTADADGLESIKAILKGLKTNHDETGNVPIVIHTSGTGLYVDDSKQWPKGLENRTCYTDSPVAKPGCKLISSLPPTAPHRRVDLAIVDADNAGYIKSYIILPSTIWGIASGRMVDAKFQNPHSQQVPSLIKFAYARRAAGYVGAGMNVWPHISIDDVSNLYVEIYRQVIHESNEVPHGPSGFFNAENGKYQYKDLAQYIANALNVEDPIKFPSNNVIPFNEVEMKEKKLGFYGSNSRCCSDNSRSIGWSPKHNTDEYFKSIAIEVKALLPQLEAETVSN